MAGLYIHVPFCKKICSYCDFCKTALISLIPEYLKAIEKELDSRKSYVRHERLETLYLGGGTPSLLTPEQISRIMSVIKDIYPVSPSCEITFEANPEDLTPAYLEKLHAQTPVNRLSVGIQSFNDSDLVFLNRRHNAQQALHCIRHAREAGYENIGIDLIYGLPGMDTRRWQRNLDLAFALEIKHLSAYHLSIEPGTAFSRMAKKGLLKVVAEEESANQFSVLHKAAIDNGFIHYEISNLAKEGYFSIHNTNYWKQKRYLGVGPSAHSYDLYSRRWNIPHVKHYLAAISAGREYAESEALGNTTRYNEFVMLSLRTMWGIDLNRVRLEFGEPYYLDFLQHARQSIASGHMVKEGEICRLTEKGWLISDYIVSGLMKD